MEVDLVMGIRERHLVGMMGGNGHNSVSFEGNPLSGFDTLCLIHKCVVW